MGHTITEKILLSHSSLKEIKPGEFIMARVDFILASDITAPLAIEEFENSGAHQVFDSARIALVLDHFVPARDISASRQAKFVRDFAKKYNIKHFYQEGKGIEHVLIPEEGLVLPGELVIGADSHTCTYGALGAFATGVGSTDVAYAMVKGVVWLRVPETIKFVYRGKPARWVGGKDLILYTISDIGVDGARYCSMELSGEVIEKMTVASRFTMANMAVEAGAKNCIIEPDANTLDYLKKVVKHEGRKSVLLKSDPDAGFSSVKEYDVSKLEPQVAVPPSPGNVKPVSELSSVNIDQAVIGSCTNGRFEDLVEAARVLKGQRVHEYVRLIIIPGSEKVYLAALREGLMETFIEAGALISPPTCGPCIGGHMGVLAKGERAIATTNRNFVGRMGHPDSQVYLSNPAIAAASAVKGRIAHPEEVSLKL